MKRLFVAALLLLLPVGAFADAPETATISGQIVDPGGSALPGVSVTLSGERGDKFGITDENGNYRFVGVTPGDYTLTATLEGLGEAAAQVRAVAGDRTSLDLTLQAAIEGEVTVTGETPMVDKFNVSAGATVSGEIGEQIGGVTRTYYGIINALPGVTADAENDDIQQTRPSVNGAHFADQGVFIDGVDTTFAKFGGSRVRVPTTALTEVSMEAGGSSAEYGRYVGSATNVIVKSGTNRFHADTLWNHQRIDWGADYKDQPSLTERTNKPYPADWFKRCHGDERDQGRGLIPGGTDGSRELEPCRPGGSEWAGASDGFEVSFGGPDHARQVLVLHRLQRVRRRVLGAAGRRRPVRHQPVRRHPDHEAEPAGDQRPLDERFLDRDADLQELLQSAVLRLLDADAARERQRVGDGQLELGALVQLVPGKAKLATQETQENKFLGCHNTLSQDNPDVLTADGDADPGVVGAQPPARGSGRDGHDLPAGEGAGSRSGSGSLRTRHLGWRCELPAAVPVRPGARASSGRATTTTSTSTARTWAPGTTAGSSRTASVSTASPVSRRTSA